MSTEAARNPDELLPTRHSLLKRLRDLDDQATWREFFELYWKLLYGAAVRAGLSDHEAEDVVQETVIGVARKMESYRYDPAVCSFKGWLMHVTRCRIADQFRRRKRKHLVLSRSNPETVTEESCPEMHDQPIDVDSIWEEEWQRTIMDAAVQRVRRSANPEHYQIFHLRVIKGLDVRDVAKLTGASVPKIYVTCHRLSHEIKAEVRRLEKTQGYA